MTPAVSSTDSVVCVTKPSAAGSAGSKRCDIGLVLDQRNGAFRQLPHRADHLGVAGMADQEDMAAEALVAHRLLVDLGDQRTGRVEIEEVARLGVGGDGFRHAMGGEDDRARLMLRRDLVTIPR